MKEVKTDYPFFEYFEKHFKRKEKSKPLSKDMPTKRLRCSTHKVEKSVSPSLETNVPIALELDQESPSSPISHKVCQVYQDSSPPRAPESTSSSPDETLFSTDSCCKNKTIEILPNATKEVVRSSHPPLEAITFDHRRKEVIASPFKVVTDRHQPVDKVIEQNNYTNQAIHVIGKQLDRIEDKIENKVILQPGNSSKPIQVLEKPLDKLSLYTDLISISPKANTSNFPLDLLHQLLELLIRTNCLLFHTKVFSACN